MQLSKWSYEIVALVFVTAVFVIAFSNSAEFTGMIVSETEESSQEELPLLGEGCEYIDVSYTENVCTDDVFAYSITREQFLNNRYAIEYVCTGIIMLKNEDIGPGTWKLGYVFDIEGKTYEAEPIFKYIESGQTESFRFEHACEEDTEFNGVYFIIEQPTKYMCGPVTKLKKEIQCGFQE